MGSTLAGLVRAQIHVSTHMHLTSLGFLPGWDQNTLAGLSYPGRSIPSNSDRQIQGCVSCTDHSTTIHSIGARHLSLKTIEAKKAFYHFFFFCLPLFPCIVCWAPRRILAST